MAKMHLCTIFVTVYGIFIFEGEARSVPRPRIIGGEAAHINQYSFVAALNVETANGRYFCGGSLYSNQWIITAGQCVDGLVVATIHLGSVRLTADDPNRRTLASSEYVIHESYSPMTLEHDIGLMRLRMPIEFSGTDYIRPIAPLAMHELASSANLRVVGWGQISDSNSALSEELQVVRVSSILNDECRIVYGNQIATTMICVEGNYNEGACHGDTGSPLLDAYSKYTAIHVGIASFISSKGCESTDPSGYTRTYPYVRWIYNITQTS